MVAPDLRFIIERIAAAAGALTLTPSTSDTTGATSLGGVDLYDDTFSGSRMSSYDTRTPSSSGAG